MISCRSSSRAQVASREVQMLKICQWQRLGHPAPPQAEVVSSAGFIGCLQRLLASPQASGKDEQVPLRRYMPAVTRTCCREIEHEVLVFELHTSYTEGYFSSGPPSYRLQHASADPD